MESCLVVSSLEDIKTRARGNQVKNIIVIFATFKYNNKVEFRGISSVSKDISVYCLLFKSACQFPVKELA